MPCFQGMPVRRGDTIGSGCRRDCLHRAMVADYRVVKAAADEARKLEREAACNGFTAEGIAWDAEHPALTFKDFLLDRRRPTV
jgi:hypothetical protein